MQYLEESTIGREALRRAQVVLSLLRSLDVQRPRILEIGCGNGWLAENLQSMGPVTGIDLADAAIEAARRRVPGVEFETGNILNLKLPTQSFDVVVTLETLSHVEDQRRFVEIAAHVLSNKGYLILTTQNRIINMRNSHVKPPAEGQLRRWCTKKELRALLSPHFKCLQLFTIEPLGDMGFLRIVNSRKLNAVLLRVFSKERIQEIKEFLGWGQTIVALAAKRD
jgi:2-polyprenyl-3-methyl-5-hydroxy-6-metoxy-1,4-benzoquinol methylase